MARKRSRPLGRLVRYEAYSESEQMRAGIAARYYRELGEGHWSVRQYVRKVRVEGELLKVHVVVVRERATPTTLEG